MLQTGQQREMWSLEQRRAALPPLLVCSAYGRTIGVARAVLFPDNTPIRPCEGISHRDGINCAFAFHSIFKDLILTILPHDLSMNYTQAPVLSSITHD